MVPGRFTGAIAQSLQGQNYKPTTCAKSAKCANQVLWPLKVLSANTWGETAVDEPQAAATDTIWYID